MSFIQRAIGDTITDLWRAPLLSPPRQSPLHLCGASFFPVLLLSVAVALCASLCVDFRRDECRRRILRTSLAKVRSKVRATSTGTEDGILPFLGRTGTAACRLIQRQDRAINASRDGSKLFLEAAGSLNLLVFAGWK